MEEGYTVSARKFRPQTFSQVVGQPHIVRTLANAIKKNRIGHAYLFSGVRGVGKTTMARILAKALNCEKGPTPEPCLSCDNCKEIAAGRSIDVMEIDGASNRGIDNIRELREKISYAPVKSRYKIYIIDEVHQITKDAFNALLKTLEEPPAHVVFIFATTELSKVPETILSRCQSYEYKMISTRDIENQLRMIAENEGLDISGAAIGILARRARGSMRDAQSLFDQAAAYGGGSVTEDDVQLILGMVDRSLIHSVIDAVVAQDKAKVMDLAERVGYSGSDPVLFLEDLSETIRNIMAAKIRPGEPPGLDDEENKKLKSWAEALSFDEIQRFFATLMETVDEMRFSHQPSLNMEMGLLRMTEKRGAVSIDSLIEKVAMERERVEAGVPEMPVNPVPAAEIPQSAAAINTPSPQVDVNVEPASPEVSSVVGGEGGDFVEKFRRQIKRPVLKSIFETAMVQAHDDTVAITVDSLYAREQLEEMDNRKRLEEIAEAALGRRARVVIKYQSESSSNDEVKKKKE